MGHPARRDRPLGTLARGATRPRIFMYHFGIRLNEPSSGTVTRHAFTFVRRGALGLMQVADGDPKD